jgi:hypothetical protein
MLFTLIISFLKEDFATLSEGERLQRDCNLSALYNPFSQARSKKQPDGKIQIWEFDSAKYTIISKTFNCF